MVKNSGSRMLLRQIPTPIQWDNLNSSLMRDEQIFNMPPMEKMSSSVVDNYIEAHPNGRSAKFAKEIERQKKELEMRNNNSPRIGAGFENGGIILL
ncbi:hypothetical protein GPJ56_008278 [Histomonas meleagridis]|uniref:uncharacterized protein n=1 Tax=Histomonas meleagridis TaxID=135588 RepID=UPI00355A4B6F|nr:hypothetical protein GPJ56_008278 [Histomonas meleagridis]KAH0806848.1 hypothetical protein GO595_000024 [Histomonas meleagridis]